MIKVVIVEDDLMVASINTQFALKTLGIQVVATFHNGKDALSFLKETKVDLILLDLYMPGFNGLELLRELRKTNSDIDCIMITAANDTEHIKEAMQLGIVDYLLKPFQYERFSEAMDKYLLKKKIMENGLECTQSDIDQLIQIARPSKKSKEVELQKGLQRQTLEKIMNCLMQHPNEYLTCDFIASEVNLSQVTTRRYMNYLGESGQVEIRVNYSTGGRPCVEYQLCSGFYSEST